MTHNAGCGPFDDILKNAKLNTKGNRPVLTSDLPDGSRITMHPDIGLDAHAIKPKYPAPVDHWNIVIQRPYRGGFRDWKNAHLIIDKNGEVLDILIK